MRLCFGRQTAVIRERAAAVLRWLAAGLLKLLGSPDAACREAARDASRALVAADLDAAAAEQCACTSVRCPHVERHVT